MEKNMSVSDTLRVSDSKIRGVVILSREDGTVVFRRENMIVGTGRSYISGLVSGAIAGTLSGSTKKISTIKFGTGTTLPTAGDIELEDNVAVYDTELDSDLVWKKSADEVSEVATDPATVVVGDYIYNTTDDELKIGTAGTPDTWEIIADAAGEAFPTSPTPSEDDVFYRTDNTSLYVYSKAFTVSSLSSPDIGLRFDCTIRGIVGSEASITELGLFINTTPAETLFSRLVFDPIALTEDVDAYNLSYYVYF